MTQNNPNDPSQPPGYPPPPPGAPVLPYASAPIPGMVSAAALYAAVPWYRQNWFNSLMVLLGLCIGLPLLVVCIIVLTGPVYFPKLGPDGRLKTWGVANKVAAVVLIVLWYFGVYFRLTSGR